VELASETRLSQTSPAPLTGAAASETTFRLIVPERGPEQESDRALAQESTWVANRRTLSCWVYPGVANKKLWLRHGTDSLPGWLRVYYTRAADACSGI